MLFPLGTMHMVLCTSILFYLSFSHVVFGMSMPVPKIKINAEWITLKNTQQKTPYPRRSGHVAFNAGNKLYIFGGYAEEDKVEIDEDSNGDMPFQRYATNDLWEKKNTSSSPSDDDSPWECVKQTGQIPGNRLCSAATVLNGRPYLFGGWDPQEGGTGGIILDTVHSFDTLSRTWKELDTKLPDGATSRHISLACPCGSRAFIHNHRCTDHVWIFDSKSETFFKQTTTGEGPSSRGLHAGVMLGHFALVFGGAAKNGVMSNEAFVLDTIKWEWKKVDTTTNDDKDNKPCPRAAPSLVGFNETCAVLFGGAKTVENGLEPLSDVWALTVDRFSGNGRWELLLDAESSMEKGITSPPGRNAATLTEVPLFTEDIAVSENGKKKMKQFLLQGGWAPFRQTWDDSFILRLSQQE